MTHEKTALLAKKTLASLTNPTNEFNPQTRLYQFLNPL